MATCRFCKNRGDERDLLKYGTRHYGHFACFFDAGHKIEELHEWQLRRVPALVLKKHGLMDHPLVLALVKKIDAELAANSRELFSTAMHR